MSKYFAIAALLILVPAAHAFMMFDVSWNDPPHAVGSAPATDSSGTSTDRPTTVQQATIRDDIAGLDGQAAVLDGAENSFIGFSQNPSFTSGVHRISWLAVMLTADPQSTVIAQTIDNDLYCTFLNTGNITLNQNTIGTWSLGTVYQFEALLNLDTDTYDFYFNGNQLVTGQALEPNASISQFGFQRPYGSSEFAVDNIQWEVVSGIPEPSTVSLLLLGMPSLCFAYGKLNPRKQTVAQ